MNNRGFTLIEMILTLIVGSIMVLGIAGFVELGTKGYADSIVRQRIQIQAQFMLEKLSREFRHAVPNSFKEENSGCLTFTPIRYSGFYVVMGKDIEFLIGNDENLNTIPSGLKMVVNPTRKEDLDNSNLVVGDKTKDSGRFVLEDQASDLNSNSVSQRHYVFDPNGAVEYCLTSFGTVTRDGVQVADNVVAGESQFYYKEATLQRGGIVHLKLTFRQNSETSVYQQDVQVMNVP